MDVAALRGEERLIALELMKTEADMWRPDLEKRVDDLELEVTRVNKFLERERRQPAFDKPGLFGPHASASVRPPAGFPHADGARGHRFEPPNREGEFGFPATQPHGLVKGTYNAHPSRITGFMPEHQYPSEFMRESGLGRLPKVNFPQFDGSKPQLWKKCENYFEMYDTEYYMWVKVSSMHFVGRAERWLQSVERRLRRFSWEEFCSLIHDRFGREQHETLIRQLFHISQSGSVSDYVEQFASLVDELGAYESRTDPLYYTMRFVDGLKYDIKSVVMVQRPQSLDAACALALVQEEALEPTRRRRAEPFIHRKAWPQATASEITKVERVGNQGQPTEKLIVDSTRHTSPMDRVATLKSYRRARGLCDRCAEKWTPGHKCATTVQLHAIEEVWDLLTLDDQENTEPVSSLNKWLWRYHYLQQPGRAVTDW